MQSYLSIAGVLAVILLFGNSAIAQALTKTDDSIRIATCNVALNRTARGELSKELLSGASKSARGIAEVIQIVRPDILLLNEVDFDEGESAKLLEKKYLAVGQNNNRPLEYKYHYTAPVNTGVDSGLDLNNNGKLGEPNDAYGFGNFPGQYGMVIFSNFEIDSDSVKSFQKFLWKDMPDATIPVDPKTGEKYYANAVMEKFRLSSKSHWDVPIRIGDTTIHLLASHPTPPVFDGDEDRNGCRNHDEIRIWSDYVSGKAGYLYDDDGGMGGLNETDHFVIAGDLNADPEDGQTRSGAIQQLLNNPRINGSFAPESTGGKHWSNEQGGRNISHKGNPLNDTGDFDDQRVGNMRIDYVLPSKTLKVVGSGVFWPLPDENGAAAAQHSDHRLVWIDVQKP